MARAPRASLRSWLTLSHLAVLVLPLLTLWLSGALAADLRNQTRWDLENQAAILAVLVEEELPPPLDASSVLSRIGARTLAGIRITDLQGRVIASSGDGVGEDLSLAPEVKEALQGRPGVTIRPRDPTKNAIGNKSRGAGERVFVAQPLWRQGQVVGAVVLSRTPRDELEAMLEAAPTRMGLTGVLALTGTLLLAVASAFVLTRNLRSLASGSAAIARHPDTAERALAGPRSSRVAEVADVADGLTRMAEALSARLGYIAEFASHVSHEFKTPLSTLKGTIELLADDEQMPPEQRRRFLVNASAEVERLERLVTGLLTLARAEQGQGHRPFDLRDLLERVGARYGLALEGQTTVVVGNPDQLEAVADNLVANARAHGAEPIRLIAFVEPDRAGFEVRDAGAGISPGNLDKIFERFFTTKRGDGGIGLGLALARTICRAHHGEITVYTAPGDTRFRVQLPLNQ